MKNTLLKNIDVEIQKESKESPVRVLISLKMEIILSCLLFSNIEKIWKEAFLLVASKALGLLLCRLDDLLQKEKEFGVRICRFFKRTLLTSFGKIDFRYRQVKFGDEYFSPLLKSLGIVSRQKISDGAKENAVLASIYTSYRKALKIAVCMFSLFSLWNFTQKEGRFYRDRRERAFYYYSEGGGNPEISASPEDFAIIVSTNKNDRNKP